MPIHNWKRVAAGIFHHFHHDWITEISRTLNKDLLPEDYYAMAEQQAAGFGPDVLTLQMRDRNRPSAGTNGPTATSTLTRPRARFSAQTDIEFYRRKKSAIAIRHVSDDRLVAMVEILSPGNKSSKNGWHAFLEKVCDLLEQRIHLLLIDLFPPTRRDPNGIHAAIWQQVEDEAVFIPPPDKPLTLAAYESSLITRAFVEPVAVGDVLPEMPLILEPDAAVLVPLEETYQRAFDAVPRRWKSVLEPA
jgi:hypothetical protein